MNRHQFVARKPMKHAGARGFSAWAVSINLLLLGALLVMEKVDLKDANSNFQQSSVTQAYSRPIRF